MSERLEGFTTIEELRETFALDPRFLSAYLAAEDVDQMIEIAEEFEAREDPALAQDIEEARDDIVRATVADELEQAGVGAIANGSLDSFFAVGEISAYDSFEGIRDTAFMRGVAELEDDITETFRDFPAAVAIAGGCYRADSLDAPCHAFVGRSWVEAARAGGIEEAMREAYASTLDREAPPATERESAQKQEERELEKAGKEKGMAYRNLDTVEGAARLAADVKLSVLGSSQGDLSRSHVKYLCELACNGRAFSTPYQCNPSVHGEPTVASLLYSLASDTQLAESYDVYDFADDMGFAKPSEAIRAYEQCERSRDWFRDALGIDAEGAASLINTLNEREEEVAARASAIREERAAAEAREAATQAEPAPKREARETRKPERDQWVEAAAPARGRDGRAPSPAEDARAFRARAASIEAPAQGRGRSR